MELIGIEWVAQYFNEVLGGDYDVKVDGILFRRALAI